MMPTERNYMQGTAIVLEPKLSDFRRLRRVTLLRFRQTWPGAAWGRITWRYNCDVPVLSCRERRAT